MSQRTERTGSSALLAGPEPVTRAGSLLGESPVWDDASGRLLWVDIWGGMLHATNPRTGTTTDSDLGAPLSSVVLSTRGSYIVTAGLCVLELTEEGVRHLADVPEPPCMRANDAAVDPAGRLWIGTMAMPNRPKQAGTLWRLDHGNGIPVRVVGDLALANGIAWSPSGDEMYLVDSTRQQIRRYPFNTAHGSVGAGQQLLHIPPEDGMPDGIAVDVEGCVWVALAGGGAVRRYGPSGALDQHVALPVRFPTSCAFGGPALRDLFITTGSRPVDPEARPQEVARGAGALFHASAQVSGLPPSLMVV